MPDPAAYDVLIIGGGPAGATSALLLARAGLRTLVLEKARFPRFHIGESLLPRNYPLLVDLGLEAAARRVPCVPKYGVEFAMGDGHNVMFGFADGLIPGSVTMNIERAPFDQMLLEEARAAGAEVREGTAVKQVVTLEEGDVALATDDGQTVRGRCVLDCSGQNAVIPRHLGTRETREDSHFQRVAYFGHFENVWRRPGQEGGHPFIVMCEEAWFWLIPLDEHRTSIGMVMDAASAKRVGLPANQMLQWGIARCPVVRERTANAIAPDTNEVIANFSYSCRPYAGPGYFLVGDSATFLDPIFSSGVTLGMMAAQEVSGHVQDMLAGRVAPATARRKYIRFVERSTGVFFKLVSQYYTHSFRELFLNGSGPLRVHSAVLSVLAGQVFPTTPWCLRWRLWMFSFFLRANRVLPLVQRRERFSLMAQTPVTEPVAVGG